MLNIFFQKTEHRNGPQKVIRNILNGLDKNEIKYSINKEVYDNNLMLMYNRQQFDNLVNKSNTIIGPTVWMYPFVPNGGYRNDGEYILSNPYRKIVSPSRWVTNSFIRDLKIDKNKIFEWFAGIDIDKFKPHYGEKTNDCLIYFKSRSVDLLNKTEKILNILSQKFEVIKYGEYTEEHFIKTINNSKYSIIIDGTESQGIAINEIMSSGLPLYVIDVKFWTYLGDEYKIESSSVPYWTEKCGIKVNDITEHSLGIFLENMNNYNTREFIINNLSIDICINKLVLEYNLDF